jgi:protein-disulfide isomerase
MKNKVLLTVVIVALCAGSVFLIKTLKPNPEEALKKRIAERSFGDPKASVWVSEYFDYQCPPCGEAHKVLHDWMSKHPGKIYLQVRFFPLPMHPHAMKAAIYAECASRQKGKFWPFHDALFEHQAEWVTDSYPELKFLTYARQTGLDVNQWDVCAKDPAVEGFVEEERAKARTLGVQITPSFFVNGKMAVGTQDLIKELDSVADAKPAAS